MMLKNALKLSFSNSANIWKILLYRFLCLLCVLGLTTVLAWPIINVLIKDNFFVNLQNSFEKMIFNLNFEKIFLGIDEIFKNFVSIISNHGLMVQTILFGVFAMFLFSMLETYLKVAVNQNVYGYMSSLTKYGFTNSLIANFGKATVLGLAQSITILPVNLIVWFGAYFMASALYAKIGVLAIVLTLFLLIVMLSLKETIFSGWIPAIIVHDEPVFKSLKRGIVAVIKRFFRTLSSFLIATLSLFVINVFAIFFTAGVGILITLPITTVVLSIIGEVMYFESLGMRFYVDAEHIVSPKKLEQQDSFSKVKDII